MMSSTQSISAEARQFNWLLSSFAAGTAGVLDAVAVSSDGLLVAASATVTRADAERLSAVVSAINSFAASVSCIHDLGMPKKVIIDLDRGYLLVTEISDGSILGVIVQKDADLSGVAYNMAVFANEAGDALTPAILEELKVSVTQ